MSLDYSYGGLRTLNIELMSKSWNFGWIARRLKKEEAWEKSWKTISNYFLNKYGGLKFLLQRNYDEKLQKKTNIPHFYKSTLQHFVEIKVAYNCAIGQELVLFNNREILIRSQTIFVLQRMVFERNLPYTGSFTGKWPISCIPEFLQRYEVECNFLNFMKAVSAIPKHLLTKAKEKNI